MEGVCMSQKNIPFSPPDITEAEISAVAEVLRSGWITTGPKTKLFEEKIAKYCHTEKAVCLNSATACMELILRLFGLGEGDEVITSAYTYTASASVIINLLISISTSYLLFQDILYNNQKKQLPHYHS